MLAAHGGITDRRLDSAGDVKQSAVWVSAFTLTIWPAGYYDTSAAGGIAFAIHAAVLVPILGLADPRWRSWVERRFPTSPVGGALIWVALLGLVAGMATPSQRTSSSFVLLWACYLALPIVLFTLTSPGARLVLAAAALLIPFGMIPMIRVAAPGRPTLNFGVLVVVDLALMLLLLYRRDNDVVYRLWVSTREAVHAATTFLAYAMVAAPLGFLLGFLRPGLGEHTVGAAVARLVQLFFLVALPEELAFRGLLQNGLERLLGSARGLIIAAVIFGLSHIGHAPAPNWRYALLATVAGLAYGWVFQRTRSITAAAVPHVLVDWTWFVFLAGAVGK